MLAVNLRFTAVNFRLTQTPLAPNDEVARRSSVPSWANRKAVEMATEAFTAAPVHAARPDEVTARPEFIRLPRPGHHCPYSGLTRSGLNALILGPDPPVQSVCLRKQGKLRGTRLIDYASLMGFLRGQGARGGAYDRRTNGGTSHD